MCHRGGGLARGCALRGFLLGFLAMWVATSVYSIIQENELDYGYYLRCGLLWEDSIILLNEEGAMRLGFYT